MLLAFFSVLGLFILFSSCQSNKKSGANPVHKCGNRQVDLTSLQTLDSGTTYLSVYSEIYGFEHRSHDLTATVSIRNLSLQDSIFILKAKYYNTEGRVVRSYFDAPVYILPMETVEIVIDRLDKDGGSGANFLFNWMIPNGAIAPFFEAVMISTSGQQGLSFTTQGIPVK